MLDVSARILARMSVSWNAALTNRSVGRVSNGEVELFSLQDEEVVSWLHDATFVSNRSCSVYVVAGHHAYRDASFTTYTYRVRNLYE